MFGLFCQMRDVCRQVLEMPHARLWQIDRERNSVLCLYNNTVRGLIKAPALALDLPSAALLEMKPVRYCSQADDAQNGRLLPFLGCFPGEVARSRKVVICNDATSDSRFQSWQYREMQDETNEPLVPFLSPLTPTPCPPAEPTTLAPAGHDYRRGATRRRGAVQARVRVLPTGAGRHGGGRSRPSMPGRC